MKFLQRTYIAIIFLLLYAPILVLILFSFNESGSLSHFSAFSMKWYAELFRDDVALTSLRNSLILAVLSSVLATVIGTLGALGLYRMRSRFGKSVIRSFTNIPMMNPDIVTGVSMMLLFVATASIVGIGQLGFGTMLIAHTTFNLPYVILSVLPKFQQMDRSLCEAAEDLGCTPVKTFFKIELPQVLPGVISGLMLGFTLSLDDFVISYFTQGNNFQTLPIRIYSMTKKTVTPKMYALATLIFFAILALLLLSNVIDNEDTRRIREARKNRNKGKKELSPKLRRRLSYGVLAVLAAAVIAAVVLMPQKPQELNVYNWGEYISDGSEDSLDTIKAFEEWYEEEYGTPVQVNYQTFASNEDMYAKLKAGAVSYDVVVPSDYMIARMKEENMLLPLDFDNIPNYETNIPENFRGLYFDENNEYTVPYTYGVVGIIYNANVVDEADANDWDLMWNEKYAGQILQFNNSRDGFGTAQYRLGYDVNDEDHAKWDEALQELKKQNPLVKSYVMDEIYNMMESGEAAIAAYYAGDYFTMLDAEAEDVDLQFYYPERTNYFVDAMCIPSCCQNKELAEIFINYMLSEEPAIANAEYIWYATPNRVVYENEDYIDEMGEEAMDILYQDQEHFNENYNAYAYRSLSPEMLDYLNSLWEELKIG